VSRAEDNIAANIEFANGAIGHYFASYTAKGPQHGTRLRVLGSEGSLEIMHGSLTFFNPKNSSTPEVRQYPNFDNGFRNEWQAFYDAVSHSKTYPSTAEQCYLDQLVITTMLDSAARYEIMKLAQET
jgi:predicted dehydrogenase